MKMILRIYEIFKEKILNHNRIEMKSERDEILFKG